MLTQNFLTLQRLVCSPQQYQKYAHLYSLYYFEWNACPGDTIKVRLQADGRKHEDVRRYTGPFHAVQSLSKETHSLYGMAPRLCLPAQQCGGQLAFLPTTHQNRFCMILHHLEKLVSIAPREATRAFVHIIASGLSGLAATISSHPFDVTHKTCKPAGEESRI